MHLIKQWFQLDKNHSSIRQEIIAGITTFLTMSYIIVVIPGLLSKGGIDQDAVFLATCITTILGSVLCAVLANYPIAIAPSVPLNAFLSFVVVNKLGFSWQAALAMVSISGVCLILLTAVGIRQWLLNAIPTNLSKAITAGIGLFIGLIAMKNLGLIVADQNTLTTLGNVTQPSILLALLGFCLIIFFEHRKYSGAILYSIIIVSVLGLLFGLNQWQGIVAMPPSLKPTFLQFDFHGLISIHSFNSIFTFLLIALFDSTGTLLGLIHLAKYKDGSQKMQKISHALIAEGITTISGGMLGTSTTCPYIENATGISAGGRTGLTAIVVAACFSLTIFLSPFAKSVPVFAYAPALLYVACVMFSRVVDIDWKDPTESFPAILIILLIPLSFSIIDGIAIGFICYFLLKVATGKFRQIKISMAVLMLLFIAYFIIADFAF